MQDSSPQPAASGKTNKRWLLPALLVAMLVLAVSASVVAVLT